MNDNDKKRVKETRNDFNLHTALIMRDGIGKTDAVVLAYSEGKAGLSARLNPKGAVL